MLKIYSKKCYPDFGDPGLNCIAIRTVCIWLVWYNSACIIGVANIHLYSPRNMVAQANKTANKNTTNEKETNIMTVPLYTHKPCNNSE